jgi:hypothetical protein
LFPSDNPTGTIKAAVAEVNKSITRRIEKKYFRVPTAPPDF